MSNNNFFTSRRFKYGAVAIVLSVVFVAVVLLFNVMLTVIGQKYSLYADLTREEFYTVSDASREQLQNIQENVEIVFFQKKEDIADPTQSESALGYVKYLAEEYSKSFDFVSVKYIDMLSSPAAVNVYRKSTNDNIRTDSVIVSCPSTGKQQIVQLRGFFSFDSSGNLYGFNGEKRITSCILQVANTKKPRVLFTIGHNEYLSGVLETPLEKLLYEQGYEVGFIDLATQDIPEGTDLVIINQPAKDFAGLGAENAGGTNEIVKIKNHIQEDYGDVILVLSAANPDLPELRELLEENFGLSFTAQTVLADTSANTVGNDGVMLIAKGAGDADSFEYSIHKSVTEKGIKIISPYSVPLKIVEGSNKKVAPVLVSSKDSVIMSVTEPADSVAAPETPLVAVSSKVAYDENQNEKRGSLLLVGSLMFEMTDNQAYGNADFLYGALKSFGNTAISLDIPTKPFNDDFLDVTKKDANAMTILVTAVLPLLILIIGGAVWLRRKSK